ncbi:expressed unknown protein [Seminavis robusta]|uniref:Uncharacterized protein n=1 Tax=Seminavis robusta TaxID=568900 RepID=A0A9N8HXU7_9STRA|nr:expressed unknown protein [Seminavis robusta]|eukprot:Sro3357_g347180.1 n/a (127) ;mRNA; r:3778-4158
MAVWLLLLVTWSMFSGLSALTTDAPKRIVARCQTEPMRLNLLATEWGRRRSLVVSLFMAADPSKEDEMDELQNQLALIEALEERNKAQLDSFVDEQDQWDSLEEEEREFLLQKDTILKRIDELGSA